MTSPKPYASVSEELSDVQVLDSGELLVTASSSVPSLGSARVIGSIEPLVPTARVQGLDSNEPLVLPCVSSVLDEPVAGPSVLSMKDNPLCLSDHKGFMIYVELEKDLQKTGNT